MKKKAAWMSQPYAGSSMGLRPYELAANKDTER